jgi:PTS system cellobiose-specific IIB component
MKNIVLVCSAGMSTSLLVSKMEKAATEKGVDAKISAISSSVLDQTLSDGETSGNPVNVILLGPQVRYLLDDVKKQVSSKNIPVDIIDMKDYGLMNGEKVLQTALDLKEVK